MPCYRKLRGVRSNTTPSEAYRTEIAEPLWIPKVLGHTRLDVRWSHISSRRHRCAGIAGPRCRCPQTSKVDAMDCGAGSVGAVRAGWRVGLGRRRVLGSRETEGSQAQPDTHDAMSYDVV